MGIRLLIAEGDPLLAEQVSAALSSCCETVGFAADGEQAVGLLDALQPDLLLADLMLRKRDGLDVLRYASMLPSAPLLMATGLFLSDYAASMLSHYGVQYFIQKPYAPAAAAARVAELLGSGQAPSSVRCCADPEQTVSAFLSELGVPVYCIGYRYLCEAVIACIRDRDLVNAVTKELYPQVAAVFRTEPAHVECAIRRAIEAAWNTGDQAQFRRLLGPSRSRPANSAFIAAVSELLRRRLAFPSRLAGSL